MNEFVATGAFAAGDKHVELGFEPKAVILWWTRQPEHGVQSGNSGGIGFWAANEARAAAWSSDDDVAPTRTARYSDEVAVVGLIDGQPALRGSLAPTRNGFDLTWDGGGSWTVHYLAFDATVAATVGWLSEDVVTGFAPDLVFISPVGVERQAVVERGLAAGFGAAAATGQVSAGFVSCDGSEQSDVAGAQRRDAAVLSVESPHELEALGRIELGKSGFAVNWKQAPSTSRLHPYIALGGVRAAVGTALSPAKPGRRRTRRIGFTPEAVMFFTWGLSPRSGPTDIGRLCLGAATERVSGCAGWDDRDVPARTTATHVCSSDDRVLLVTKTQSGELHAAAGLHSLDRRGFTLNWSLSDGFEREVAFVALARPRRP